MNDVLGWIRVIKPRYAAAGQREAMVLNSIDRVLQNGAATDVDKVPEGLIVAEGDIPDLIRIVRPGTLVAVLHAHLLANPERRNVRGGTRRDFRKTWEALHAKGAVIWELYTGRRSDKPADREAIALDAVDALAMGRHKTRRSDKRGRPEKMFSEEQWAQAEKAWESRRLHRWQDVEKKLPKGMTLKRAWARFGPRNVETQ